VTPPWPCAAGPNSRLTEALCPSVMVDRPGERASVGHALFGVSEMSLAAHTKHKWLECLLF
jgi:hypothetical protein